MTKRYLAEFIGTFVIVFCPVIASANHLELSMAAWLSGLAVTAMVYALGPISAAHYNPAVTLAFAVTRKFPWKFVAPYMLCQFAGGAVAGLVGSVMFAPGAGVHHPVANDLARNVGTELFLAFFLMLVVAALATDRRVNSTVPARAIGLTVVTAIMVGGPVTGASMNPARSFGPALWAGSYDAWIWLYLLVPPCGAVLGAVVYEALRLEPEHSVGAPNELLEALQSVDAESRT